MSEVGDELVVTISSSSNVEDGVAHPWGSNEHVHIRKDGQTPKPKEKYKIELISYNGQYWIGEVIEEIDVKPRKKSESKRVYWVVSSKSYCYHTSQNCQSLNKHAGAISSALINREKGEIPEPVKQRRPCSQC